MVNRHIRFIVHRFRRAAKRNPFIGVKPLRPARISESRDRRKRANAMKNVMHLFLALIPLAAVLSAYVAVP